MEWLSLFYASNWKIRRGRLAIGSFVRLSVRLYVIPSHLYIKRIIFLARLHLSAEELLLYPRRRRPRPHTKC